MLHADWTARFERLRLQRSQPARPAPLSVTGVRAALLEQLTEELERFDQQAATFTPSDRESWDAFTDAELEVAGIAQDSGKVQPEAIALLDAALKRRGLTQDDLGSSMGIAAKAEAQAAYVHFLVMQSESATDTSRTLSQRAALMGQRRVLAAIEPSVAAPAGGLRSSPLAPRKTLRDAFTAWRAKEPDRKQKTVDTFETALERWEREVGPEKALSQVTREVGLDFERALKAEAKEKGRSLTTQANTLSRVKTLFRIAVDLEWIDRSPLQGRSIEADKSQRRLYAPEDLRRLFDHPLFTEYRLPREAMAGKDAAYWVPLLGLFTGARLSELCQLTPADVTEDAAAGLVLRITDESAEGASVKSAKAIRRVPVHPELLRLGFADYCRAVRDAGASRLWPALKWTELNGAGGKLGQWFGKFKTAQGFGREHVFHSFRHTVRTRLTALKQHEAHIDALLGHEASGAGEGRSTYTALSPADLRPTMDALSYPELALPRVFVAPAWGPKDR